MEDSEIRWVSLLGKFLVSLSSVSQAACSSAWLLCLEGTVLFVLRWSVVWLEAEGLLGVLSFPWPITGN